MSDPTFDNDARERRARNIVQLVLLAAGAGFLVSAIAWSLAGPVAGLAAIAVMGGLAFACREVPGVTVVRLFNARALPRDDSQLSSLIDVLAHRAGLSERPDLYVIPSMTMAAFTAGTRSPAIAVTEGLLRRLSLRETAGVVAHEMSHIRSGDLEVMAFADLVTRAMQLLAYLGLALAVVNLYGGSRGYAPFSWLTIALLYLAPFLSSLLQLALSREREFEADKGAVAITGDPQGLASVLRRVDGDTGAFWDDLMLPVPGRKVAQPSLLRSHPPSEERIRRLMAIDATETPEPLDIVEQPMVVGLGAISLRPRHHWTGVWY